MKTRNLPQLPRTGDGARPVSEGERRQEPVFRGSPPTEAHWDELHGRNSGSASDFVASLRNGLRQRSWTDLAIGLAAGLAAGWLLSSRHRSHAMRDRFIGSLLPTASRRAHHAYDALRGTGALREWGHRVGKLKSRW